MDATKQRIAIAEYLGLKVAQSIGDNADYWFTEEMERDRRQRWRNACVVRTIPDYLNDLNAMHEAEKFLDTTNGGPRSADCLRYMYSNILYKLCPEWVQPFRAPANLRAEAFLKTIGKWE